MSTYKLSAILLAALWSFAAVAQWGSDIDDLDVELQDSWVEPAYEIQQTDRRVDRRNRRDRSSRQGDGNVYDSPSQGIVILNRQDTRQDSWQGQESRATVQQPTTYVEASPLQDSRAERMRQQRQSAEVQTEQKIVEKLEESRMEDEKRRAERLFGDRLGPQPEPQQHYHPPAPPVVPVKEEKVVVIKEEPAAVEVTHSHKKPPHKDEQTFYFGAAIGMADYPDANNIEGNYALGFSVGTYLDNNVVVEGTFLYSNYYVEEYWKYPPFKELDQYGTSLAVKYSILSGRFKPLVGALATYNYRKYSGRVEHGPWMYQTYGAYNESNVTTHAFDLGLLVGLDVEITNNFLVGTDFRYSMNMINKSDDKGMYRRDWMAGRTTPVEELDYYSFTLNGKIRF